MIVLDFDQPWEIMNSLNRWMSTLTAALLKTISKLKIEKRDELKRKIALHINNYERFASNPEGGGN